MIFEEGLHGLAYVRESGLGLKICVTGVKQDKSIFIGIILGTTIWLLIERDESTTVDFDHEGAQGSFQIFGSTGEFKMQQKATGDVLTGRFGHHLSKEDFESAKECQFGDYCLGKDFFDFSSLNSKGSYSNISK